MKNTPQKTTPFSSLRQKAEALLNKNPSANDSPLSEADILKLIHELEVHQVELEMQNEELKEAQKAAQDAIDLYDFAPTGYFTLSQDGEIIRLNQSGANLLQKDKDALMGSEFGFFVSNETKHDFTSFLQKVYQSKSKQRSEIALLNSGDAVLPVYLTGILDKNQQLCLVTAVNISEQKQHEEVLKLERELYEDLVNTQPAGIYRIRVFKPDKWWKKEWRSSENPPYQMELASDRFCEFLGITREEFEANPAMIADLIHPSDLDDFVLKNEDANNRLIHFIWEGRLVIRNKTSWIHLESIPRRVANMEVLWTGILYDITDQKESEEALQESETKYRQLVDNSPDAICIYTNGEIVFVNNECLRLMEVTNSEELIGKQVLEFIHPDYRQFAIERMKDVSNENQALPLAEEKFIRPDGSAIVVEVKSMPILFQHKHSFQLIVRDITERKKAENEIKKIKEDFIDLFEHAPVGYHEIDTQGRIVRINQTELKMLGYEAEDLVGGFIWKINVTENDSYQLTSEKLHGRNISITPYERIFKRKDGILINVLELDKLLYAEDGRITGIRTSVHDITERKLTEMSLQLSEEKFRNVFENSIIGKSTTTLAGIVNVNKAFCQILGYTAEELSTIKWVEFTHKDDLEFDKKQIQLIIDGKENYSQWEKRFIHKNGNIVWVNLFTILERDKEGNPLHFITEIFDITERKRVEEELLLIKQSYYDIFNSVSESIYVMDETGQFLEANLGAEKMYQIPREELIGQSPLTVAAPGMNDMDQIMKEISNVFETGIPTSFEFWGIRKDGKVFPKEVNINKGKFFNKNVLLATSRDISERKQAEESIRESEKRYRLISSVVSDYIFTTKLDINGNLSLSWVTGAFEKITGYTFDEYISVGGWRGTLHADDLEKDLQDLEELKKNHKVVSDIRTISKNGACIWVRIFAHPIWDSKLNKLTGIYGGVKDITERKITELALLESEELYRNLVLRIPDGVYKSTSGGKFLDVNPAMVHMLGYDNKEELMDINIKTQLYFEKMNRDYVIKNSQNDELSVFPLKKKDGSGIWIEDHGWYNKDKDGNIVTHEGVLRDITERKLAQDALLESEITLKKTLFESTGLIDKPSEGIDFDKISNTILEISGAKYVSFNLYDENGADFTTVALSGIKEHLQKAGSFLGFELINKKWKFDPLREEKTKENTITKFNSLSELTGFAFPKKIATLAENIFKIGDAFVVKITKSNKTIGDFTLIYSKGETLRNNELVLLYANQVALFIDRDKADKALRTKEEKYRYLFANNPQPMYIYNQETLAFMEVNQAAIDHYGYSEKEFMGMTLKDMRPSEDIPALLVDVQNKEKVVNPSGIWRHIKKNGEIIFVDITTVAVVSNGVQARHVLIQDITERMRAEVALRESEDKYRTMIENSNDLIWTLDKQGNFTFYNKIAILTAGIDPEAWIGKSFVQFLMNEDIPEITDIFNKSLLGEDCTYELRFRKTDETVLTLLVNSSPVYVSGQIEGVVSFGRDITESKESLRLLLESEEKFRSITEQTGDLISITDNLGVLIFASKASRSIFGYEPEEMCGRYFTDFVVQESFEDARRIFEKIFEKSQSVTNHEYKMKRKDGSLFYGELNGSKFEYGNDSGTLVVIRDISERKNAQQELEERMNDLLRFHNLTVDREMTMIELKKEVNKLLLVSGNKEKYKIVT